MALVSFVSEYFVESPHATTVESCNPNPKQREERKAREQDRATGESVESYNME